MDEKTSKRDVILCRGIWYVATLLSLIGLIVVTLNLLWTPEDTSRTSRFRRVSVTTLYAVTLIRYFIFFEPLEDPSTCYTTKKREMLPQVMFMSLAILVDYIGTLIYPMILAKKKSSSSSSLVVVYMALFTFSLLTGALGLKIQYKMEIKHSFLLICLFTLLGILEGIYNCGGDFYMLFVLGCYMLVCTGLACYAEYYKDQLPH